MSVQRIRTKVLAGATALAIGAGLFAGLAPLASRASSHREAPLTAADPQIDSTDLYAFVSPDRPDSVTLVSNWIPFENPAGGPNFFPWAENTNYDIRISNDGGTNADIVYRWKFTTHYRNPNTFLYNTGPVTSLNDPDLNLYQTYDLWRIAGGHKTQLLDDAPVAPSNVGGASMPNYNSNLFDKATTKFGTSSSPSYSWVGQADDPFFLDLRVFDLLYGANLSEAGNDTLAGFNVNSFAIQVPTKDLTKGSESTIGIWTTASRPSMRIENGDGTQSFKGKDVQVSRLGQPARERSRHPRGLEGLLQLLEAFCRRRGAAARPGPRAAAPPERGVRHGRSGLRSSYRGDPAGGPDPGLPHWCSDPEPARQRQGQRDAPSEHGDPAVLHDVLPAGRARR